MICHIKENDYINEKNNNKLINKLLQGSYFGIFILSVLIVIILTYYSFNNFINY